MNMTHNHACEDYKAPFNLWDDSRCEMGRVVSKYFGEPGARQQVGKGCEEEGALRVMIWAPVAQSPQ